MGIKRKIKGSKGYQVFKDRGFVEWLKYYFMYKAKRVLKKDSYKCYQKYLVQNSQKLFPCKLPQNYNFIMFYFHLSGHTALQHFFKLCGLNEIILRHFIDGGFVKLYESKRALKALKNEKNFLSIYHDYKFQNNPLPTNKILPPSTIFMNVRDPFSVIKTYINHKAIKVEKLDYNRQIKVSFLNEDPFESLDRITYAQGEQPSFASLKFSNGMIDGVCFNYFSIAKPFLKNHTIDYIDMKEFMPECAFETLSNLANKYKFSPPKESQKNEFSKLIHNDFGGILLPFYLQITKDDCRGGGLKKDITIKICETSPFIETDVLDIKESILQKECAFYNDLSFYIDKNNEKYITENKELLIKLQNYCIEFIKALEYWVDFHSKKKIDETAILNFVNKNDGLKRQMKNLLDKELVHIKQHRPDIVASWKYYNEFEKNFKE